MFAPSTFGRPDKTYWHQMAYQWKKIKILWISASIPAVQLSIFVLIKCYGSCLTSSIVPLHKCGTFKSLRRIINATSTWYSTLRGSSLLFALVSDSVNRFVYFYINIFYIQILKNFFPDSVNPIWLFRSNISLLLKPSNTIDCWKIFEISSIESLSDNLTHRLVHQHNHI